MSIYKPPLPFFDSKGTQRCPECGDPLTREELKLKPNRVFCSKVTKSNRSQCNDKLRLRAYHEYKFKTDPEYREKRRLRCKKFREDAKAQGLCARCGSKKPDGNFKVCSDCAAQIELVRTR